ncbi:MAG: lysyl oxidase family protein [Chthoniobacteraceae bacterium]
MRSLTLLLLASAVVASAHEFVTPDPKLLQDRVPVSRLGGDHGDGATFKIEIPPDAENFVVKTTGGSGDVDLFIRFGAHPSPTQWDFASESDDTSELIRVGTPTAGVWYVRVVGFSTFRNVRLTASYELPRGVARPPRLTPAPGNYSERVLVRVIRPRGTTVHFTTDGSSPTVNSPSYTRRLTFTATTQLRARTFGRDASFSIETVGDYAVVPKGTIEPLTVGMPVHHLAAVRGTAHEFKLTVPAGASRLMVRMEGGPGNAQLYAKAGAAPTTRVFDRRAVGGGNNATLEILNPAAGDWYLFVHARAGYSGVSLLATARPPGVDLISWGPALDPYLTTESFTAADCEVDEGLITAGTHRLLRFNTQTRNVGSQDLVLGDPAGNPDFEFQACHGHYHFRGFASYQLLDDNDQPVATGRKVSFCLLDGLRWDPKAPATAHYDCETQGIQAGWADVYDAGLPGQWIDVSGVPPGTYTLVITMNPDRLITESDYSNNSASTQVVITAP